MSNQRRIKPNYRIHLSVFLVLCALLCSSDIGAQIIEGNGYLIGTQVEVAVHGSGGHEGTADWPGHHARGGTDDVPFGFVADPVIAGGWADYDGDFFTAGTPENGFGLEINGTNYSNNAWDHVTATPYLNQIPTTPTGAITYIDDDGCMTLEWEGAVAGVTINVKYHLSTPDFFYTTEITLTNGTGSDIEDLYYYRNIDPDNNESIGGTFTTTNTIVSQVSDDCIKALVTAHQSLPRASYLGIGALGENFRVSHGGFSNRSGSDIWNATGGLTGTPGDIETDDKSISLAYKTDLAAGESVNFRYAIILQEDFLEEAFARMYSIQYQLEGELPSESSFCNEENIVICPGDEIIFNVIGPNVDDYNWIWEPTLEENDTIIANPTEAGAYTVTGYPLVGCLENPIELSILISFDGPDITIVDPGVICGEYNLDSLEVTVEYDSENVDCIFLTTIPDSATQDHPEFDGPWMGIEDDVWFMCGDTVTNCFSFQKLEFDFVGFGSAGDDSTLVICGGLGATLELSEMISDSANVFGKYYEYEDYPDGNLNDSTGRWDASGLYGTFIFLYVVEGIDTCQSDTAVFTITLLPPPNSRFDIAVDGYSFFEGLRSTCIINAIEFINLATVDPPQEIVSWEWEYGDGTLSDLEHPPPHTYSEPGEYGIRLVVTSDNGCRHVSVVPIKIYEEPEFEFFYAPPTCHDYTDGVIRVEYDDCFGNLIVDISDEDGTVLNEPGELEVDGLGVGTYYIDVSDSSGCSSFDEVTIYEPPEMDIFYHLMHPPCTGDSGWVVIDSVVGESDNNPIYYEWDPNPANIEGLDADSSYWMVAGDYTVTVTDSKGCTNQMDFTLVDPPPFYFTEWGWDTAYCRLYNYQSGNGVVYAAAAGGVPNYTYEWTYLVDGTTSNNSTWGGRNPGDHLITVTDEFGCVLTKVITVDSVNPIASFIVNSAQLNPNCQGTANVEVEFTNTSRYFANPENPDSDTLFFWDLDRTENDDWIICYDFFEQFDTIYEAKGEPYQVDVCLIVFNKNGCKDTACKTITIWEPPVLEAPNIFTPNEADGNNYFTFEHLQKGIRDLHCIILNRWGVQVAEILGVDGYWDGTDYGGEQCPDGVYFYSYTAIADNGEKFGGQGTVTIVDSGRQ